MLNDPKIARPPLRWEQKLNHRGSVVCISVLFNQQGVTIPGLTMILEAKAPVVTAQCLYLFSLFQLMPGGQRVRRYQLEVCPREKLSHLDAQRRLYGPHEHIDDTVTVVDDPGVDCKDWARAYSWFQARCNLAAPDLEAPC